MKPSLSEPIAGQSSAQRTGNTCPEAKTSHRPGTAAERARNDGFRVGHGLKPHTSESSGEATCRACSSHASRSLPRPSA